MQLVGTDHAYATLLAPSLQECSGLGIFTQRQALEFCGSKVRAATRQGGGGGGGGGGYTGRYGIWRFPNPDTLFQAPFVTSTAVIKRKCTTYITYALFYRSW